MKFEGEYTLTIKLSDIRMPEEHSSTELTDKIQKEGRINALKFLEGNLIDPNGKVVEEKINFKLNKI